MKPISPTELQSLLLADVDIVDVREPDEWKTGHIPGARLVPLGLLRADAAGALPRDTVVFVCAKGGRSAEAATLAEQLGRQGVFSLAGGTEGWRAAGLPIIVPGTTTAPPRPVVQEPGLDVVVGQNLHTERTARGWSLDDLAREAGVSRTVLGQVELGRSTPSIGVVWKIAQALGVPFATLLARPSRALSPADDPHAAEFYELWLAPHSREDADAHRPGTRENLVVAAGQLELKVGSEVHHLKAGDAVTFAADQPHSYANPAGEPCWMYLVMNYHRRG
jgi:rhodanese-related sulfurtransferase/transcriptional regulator with XRE-family HTH domain